MAAPSPSQRLLVGDLRGANTWQIRGGDPKQIKQKKGSKRKPKRMLLKTVFLLLGYLKLRRFFAGLFKTTSFFLLDYLKLCFCLLLDYFKTMFFCGSLSPQMIFQNMQKGFWLGYL